jgi:hypothetical protein
VAFAWAILTFLTWAKARGHFLLAAACAVAVVTPWTVRNYLVFGRLIPIKSNLAYELYQSQCLQPDGLLQRVAVLQHPNGGRSREWLEYKALGEVAFLDHKREVFWQAVRADPVDFFDRAACRFFGATLWHMPMNRSAAHAPWILRLTRLVHALPFLALVYLAFTTLSQPLGTVQWLVIGVYAFNLLPYVAISYYDRYALPLVAAQVLLVLWALERGLAATRTALRPLSCARQHPYKESIADSPGENR